MSVRVVVIRFPLDLLWACITFHKKAVFSPGPDPARDVQMMS